MERGFVCIAYFVSVRVRVRAVVCGRVRVRVCVDVCAPVRLEVLIT